MDIQNRVVNYYKNNQFIQKYLKGINTNTNEVLLTIDGVEKGISIEALEGIKTEEELKSLVQGNVTPEVTPSPVVPEVPAEPVEPTVSEPSIENATISPVSEEQTMLVDNTDLSKETLNDIKILTEIKNKDGLDNLLKKFSINESTGLIDINKAISVITRNTMNEVEKAIKNNYLFNTDASLYDIEGNYTGSPIMGVLSEDEQIMNSFNNIKVYIDASKMYPDQANYDDQQVNVFMQTYITKVKEELHGSEGTVPVAEPAKEEPIVPDTQVPQTPQEAGQVQNASTAGFADIFVLTVIVLVYAVIIVNLILKIK